MSRSFFRVVLVALALCCAALFASGCAVLSQRRAPFSALAPEPMTPQQWKPLTGIYSGTIRATTRRLGTEGVRVFEARLELSGNPESPDVFLKIRTTHSGAWTTYSEKTETFTNIRVRRYGTDGYVLASTHAPDQVLLRLQPNGLWLDVRPTMILTFHAPGWADVQWLASNGWHGEGSLRSVPIFTDREPSAARTK